MPELPEVETVVRGIRPLVTNKTITKSEFLIPRQLLPQTPRFVGGNIHNQKIVSVERRGKYILIHLENGVLLIHLRMTGRLYVRDEIEELRAHERAFFHLDDHHKLIFSDARTLGTITFHQRADQVIALKKLGWDPLKDSVSEIDLKDALCKRSVPIKVILLDQSVWSGIGNIYASEILWEAGIHPERSARLLTESQRSLLIESVSRVLEYALEKGGSTLRDFVSPEGKRGEYADEFRVYGRDGESCLRCGGMIRRIVQAQRSTYFCGRCQKKKG
jgi:formamidopyrimidine-DNA glycosylase